MTQFTTSSGRRACSVLQAVATADFDATAALGAAASRSIVAGHLRAVVTSVGTYGGNTSVIVTAFGEELTT